jgi:hypothetical protein
VTVNVEAILESIPNDATGLDGEQLLEFARLLHIALRSIRLSYEVGIETGNESIDALIKGFNCLIEEYELEIAERHETK